MTVHFGLSRKKPMLAIRIKTYRSNRTYRTYSSLARTSPPFFAFEFASLKEADEFACLPHPRHRADAVPPHQFLGVLESGVWFDKKSRRDRTHHVAGACEMPAL